MSEPWLIIFDVDGTLIDSQKTIVSAMQISFRSLGLSVPTEDEVLSIVGLSLPEAMVGISPHLDQREVEALVEAYRATFVKQREEGKGEASIPLYEGARECLLRLNEVPNYVLGTATGKARRGLDVVVAAHKLHGLFATLQTSDLHPSKPHPSMLQTASAETGIGPERGIMIGDTSFDMEMGKAAGFATVGVDWGYHSFERLSVNADIVVSHYGEIDSAIEELIKSR